MKQKSIRFFLGIIWLGAAFLVPGSGLRAAEWYQPDSYEVRTFYGRSGWTAAGPNLHDSYTWSNISLCAGKQVYPWLRIIAGLGPGYLEADDADDTPSAEFRLLGQLQYRRLYAELGGGLAYLFDRDDFQDLADSDLYGIMSASVGVEILRVEGERHNFNCKTGYRIEHLSSPFHNKSGDGDGGVNIGAFEVNFSWEF